MSGNINSHKWSSENNRYTYLHFGGRGISFSGKTPSGFLGLKSPKAYEEAQKLLLSPGTNNEPPYFSTHEQELPSTPLGMCCSRPRYWYSGDKVKEERLVVVHTSVTLDSLLHRGAFNDDIYLNGALVVSPGRGVHVMSAAAFDDPLEGECIFALLAGQRSDYTGYYADITYPIHAVVYRVRSKSEVSRKTMYPDHFGLPYTHSPNSPERPSNLTLHSLDGQHAYTSIMTFKDAVVYQKCVKIKYDGTFFTLDEKVFEPRILVTRTSSASSSHTDTSQSQWEGPDVHGSYSGSWSGGPKTTRRTSMSESGSNSVKYTLCRVEYPDESVQDITAESTYTYTSTSSNDYSYEEDGSGSEFTAVTAAPNNQGGSAHSERHSSYSKSGSGKAAANSVIKERLVVTFWDGAQVTLTSRDNSSTGSNNYSLTNTGGEDSASDDWWPAGGGVNITGSGVRFSNYDLGSSSTGHIGSNTAVTKILLYLDVYAKVAVFSSVKSVWTGIYDDQTAWIKRNNTVDLTYTNAGVEEDVHVITSEQGTSQYTYTSTQTNKGCREVLHGNSVTSYEEITIGTSESSVIHYGASKVYTDLYYPPSPYIGDGSSTITFISGVMSYMVWYFSIMSHQFHSAALGDLQLSALAKKDLMYYPQFSDSKEWVVSMVPKGAENSSELNYNLGVVESFDSVYPVLE